MLLPIVMYGHPILRKKAQRIEAIDDSILQLIADMKETLLSKNGLGLAAPQVGKSVQLFMTNVPENEDEFRMRIDNVRVFINPKILSYSNEGWIHDEGCLSLPQIYIPIPRPLSVVVQFQDETGKAFEETLSEWPARVFCHENDHINGVLTPDRADSRERKRIEPILKHIKEQFKQHNEQFN